MPTLTDDHYRVVAQDLIDPSSVIINPGAPVNRVEGGAYVLAWVYVGDDEAALAYAPNGVKPAALATVHGQAVADALAPAPARGEFFADM